MHRTWAATSRATHGQAIDRQPTTILGLARQLDVPAIVLVDIIQADRSGTNFYAHMDPDRREIRTRTGLYGDYALTGQGIAYLTAKHNEALETVR